MGTDTLTEEQCSLLRDNHFRVWREALNPIEAEVTPMEKFHNSKLSNAKKNADQIK